MWAERKNELKKIYAATLKENNMVATHIYQLKLHCPEIAISAIPGQFVHIRCSELLIPLLRRPFSIAVADERSGTLDIIYKVVGEGTLILSKKKPGDVIDVMGPLGSGFPLPPPAAGKLLLIGGGMGTAPLLFLAKMAAKEMASHGTNIGQIYKGLAVTGFSTAEMVFGTDFLESCGFDVTVMTDDGSLGTKGNPADFLIRHIKSTDRQTIYTCGPLPLLSRVKAIADSHRIPAYVSLEERMACGIGACLGCAVKTTGGGYKKVCSDGPVFKSEEIVL